MSPDGKSKPFDADANGYVAPILRHRVSSKHFLIRIARGEGGAVIVLKPLDAAMADNDHIYSVVSSTFDSLLVESNKLV